MDRLQQKKLYVMNEHLRQLHSELDFDIQSKIPLESLVEIGKLNFIPTSLLLNFCSI